MQQTSGVASSGAIPRRDEATLSRERPIARRAVMTLRSSSANLFFLQARGERV